MRPTSLETKNTYSRWEILMKSIVVAFGIALVASTLFSATVAEACSCIPQTNAETYCASDFVVKARVKKQLPTQGNTASYKIRIKTSFKGNLSGTVVLNTPSSSSLCGVVLQTKKTYLLSGTIDSQGQAKIGLCNKSALWRSLSRAERREWAAGYDCTPECPIGCDTWYDGCNTCGCTNGQLGACTKRFCFQNEEPYCMSPCPQVRCQQPPSTCPPGYTLGMQYTDNGCPTCETCLDAAGEALSSMYCMTREVWSDEKTDWCCANQGLGCDPCVVTGCSSELCAEVPTVSTCVFRAEYQCLAFSECERSNTGECGWTQTPEYQKCISQLP
jgi:hypothetical protein